MPRGFLFVAAFPSIFEKISVVPLRGLSPVAGASPVLPVNRHVVAVERVKAQIQPPPTNLL